MKILFRIPAAMLLLMFLFGCGQSGPLYVSGNPSTVEPAPSMSESDDEEEQDGESSESE